jgi:hypothetical protein
VGWLMPTEKSLQRFISTATSITRSIASAINDGLRRPGSLNNL